MKHALLLSSLLALSLGATADNGRYGRDNDRYTDRCPNCGVVDRIETRYGERRSSGGGAVAGALIGAALGNQVGGGDGRKAATVVGAIAGGVAGNRIEKSRNARDDYAVYVRNAQGVWVAAGCRAEFALGRGGNYGWGSGFADATHVVCASDDFQRRFCPADTTREATGEVVQEVSQP